MRNTAPAVFAKFCGVCLSRAVFGLPACRALELDRTCWPPVQIATRSASGFAISPVARSRVPCSFGKRKRDGEQQQRRRRHYGFSTRMRWASLSVT